MGAQGSLVHRIRNSSPSSSIELVLPLQVGRGDEDWPSMEEMLAMGKRVLLLNGVNYGAHMQPLIFKRCVTMHGKWGVLQTLLCGRKVGCPHCLTSHVCVLVPSITSSPSYVSYPLTMSSPSLPHPCSLRFRPRSRRHRPLLRACCVVRDLTSASLSLSS